MKNLPQAFVRPSPENSSGLKGYVTAAADTGDLTRNHHFFVNYLRKTFMSTSNTTTLITRKRAAIAAAVALATVGAAGGMDSALANNSTTFTASITIQASCTVSAGAMAFGTVSAGTASAVNATSALSVTCPSGQAYNVGVQSGNNASTTGAGTLKSGANTIAYAMYQDTNHTTAFGNTSGTNTVAGTGTGSAQAITVYGQVAGGAIPLAQVAGTYNDNVTVTVYY